MKARNFAGRFFRYKKKTVSFLGIFLLKTLNGVKKWETLKKF